MTVITVSIVSIIIVRSAAHIARDATTQSAWDVLTAVPHAMSRSVRTAYQNAGNVKRHSVKIV